MIDLHFALSINTWNILQTFIRMKKLISAQDKAEVIKMALEYKDLDDLLNRNPKAKDFFDSLPEDRQFNVRQYQNNIHYDLDLRRYAEHLLRGGY